MSNDLLAYLRLSAALFHWAFSIVSIHNGLRFGFGWFGYDSLGFIDPVMGYLFFQGFFL